MAIRTQAKSSRQLGCRYTPVGSVVLSYDFYLGIPIGVVATLGAIFSAEVREAISGVLIGVAGVGAAMAALILTSLTVVLSTMTPAYRALLKEAPEGLVGATKPFKLVIIIAVSATSWALIAAGITPLVSNSGIGTFLVAAPAFSLLLWAVFGCVQLTDQLVQHISWSQRADEQEERRLRLANRQ